MLSRVAEQVYWMARYVERAQNLARIIDVVSVQSGEALHPEAVWGQILNQLGEPDTEIYQQDESLVADHLIYSPSCPVSIRWCITRARENARLARGIISRELWQGLTVLHSMFEREGESRVTSDDESTGFLEQVILQAHAFQGMVDSTLLQDEAFHFMRIGMHLERALSTLMVLQANLDGILENWAEEGPSRAISVLKSVTAYGAFRHSLRATLAGSAMLEFLVFEARFPRSVIANLHALQLSMAQLPDRNADAMRLVGRLCSQLTYDTIQTMSGCGIAAYLQKLADDTRQVHGEVQSRYFNPEVIKL